ncbi:MAG: thioredoxin family protein [Phycisphaerales bacterium]|nr:thioredoxin family protein [Phycisphaerales bacterium]
MKRNLPILAILLAFAGFLWLRGGGAGGGGHAEKPPLFAQNLTFAQARQQATGTSRVIMVLATADWCPPCQELKRGALRDARIEAWVRDNALPVYIDTDDNPTVEGLMVMAIPTIVMLKDGAELGRLTSSVSAEELLSWLQSTAPKAGG